MITLDIKEYCANCPHFEPISDRLYFNNAAGQTVVRCEHSTYCGYAVTRNKELAAIEKELQNMKPPKSYDPVQKAYDVLVNNKSNNCGVGIAVAVEEAIGYLGEALE